MIEPTGKTFELLVLDFAIEAGMASYGADGAGAPAIPTSAHNLAECKRWVNKGYREFIGADPNWTFSMQPFELTFAPAGDGPFNINGDAGRYRCPPWVQGNPRGNWRYNDTSTDLLGLQVRPHDYIERMLQASTETGDPAYAATRPAASAAGRGGWEWLFWPRPNTIRTIRGDFRVLPYDMVDLGERHVAGAEHDEAILKAALHVWTQADSDDATEKAQRKQEWVDALAKSREIDRPQRPRNRGRFGDPAVRDRDAGMSRTRDPQVVRFYNGNPIP